MLGNSQKQFKQNDDKGKNPKTVFYKHYIEIYNNINSRKWNIW